MTMSQAWTQQRRRAQAADVQAVLHFRDGDRLAVDVDAENGGYLRTLFERRGRRRFDWFETTDGFLIGADLAAVEAIDWLPPAAAPAASPLDGDHLVLRFSDGYELQLSQITADDIDRLRGVTICDRTGKSFELEDAVDPPPPIPVETLVLVTLPARWMDAEPT
jgi:hypothetical protein